MPPADLNLLETFATVVELRSFSDAADKLGVQRSSVSRGIAALEDQLGVQLFARTTRSVAATTAGATLYAKVRPQLSSLQEALRALPEREEAPSGVLRLTAPNDIGATILPDVIAGFVARHPAVTVELSLGNAQVDIITEGFDAAIRAAPAKRKDSSLVSRKLSDLDLQLFASPTYLAAHGTPRKLEDVREHEWVSFRCKPMPAPLPKALKPARVTADDMLFARGACVAGLGLTLLPSFTARDDVAAGRLVRVLPKVELGKGALYFVHAPTQHVPRKVTAFRDYFLEWLATSPLA
jgi:DNA-binding transcriptional LysR family regulator